MRLQYTCSSCKKLNYFTPSMHTRGDLQMKIGDEAKVNCSNCGYMEKKHINKIVAVADNRIIVGALILGTFLTLILGSFFGLIGVFTLALPIIAWVNENRSTNNFNKYRIRRK